MQPEQSPPTNPVITPLTWESDFFSQRIGRVELSSLERLNEAACAEWQLVQAKVPSDAYYAIDRLSALGFALVEGEAELVLPLLQTERQVSIKIARPTQIAALQQLAMHSFQASRFRTPWFAVEPSRHFYARWIENAVLGRFDDQCLVATDEQGAILGMVSLRAEDKATRIGLLAVAASQQKTGIGQRLLLAAADWARVRGGEHLLIATQLSNVPALRLYTRNGAYLVKTHYWFYRRTYDPL